MGKKKTTVIEPMFAVMHVLLHTVNNLGLNETQKYNRGERARIFKVKEGDCILPIETIGVSTGLPITTEGELMAVADYLAEQVRERSKDSDHAPIRLPLPGGEKAWDWHDPVSGIAVRGITRGTSIRFDVAIAQFHERRV